MRYVVVYFGSDCPHCEGDEDYEDCTEVPAVYKLIPCDDVAAVCKTIAGCASELGPSGNPRRDWNIFELVDGAFVPRSIIRPDDAKQATIQ